MEYGSAAGSVPGGVNPVSAPFAGARIAPGPGIDVGEVELEPAKPIMDTEVDGYKEQDVSNPVRGGGGRGRPSLRAELTLARLWGSTAVSADCQRWEDYEEVPAEYDQGV